MGKISQKFQENQKKVKLWHVAVILIIIVAGVASLVKRFNYTSHRNEGPARAVVKGFSWAIADYRDSTGERYVWNDGETEFKDANGEQLYSHRFTKGGYDYKYFSNSVETGPGKATKFVYLCFPVKCSTGRRAFYIDENLSFFEVPVKDEETLAKFEGIRPDFNVPAGENRFARYGLGFVLK